MAFVSNVQIIKENLLSGQGSLEARPAVQLSEASVKLLGISPREAWQAGPMSQWSHGSRTLETEASTMVSGSKAQRSLF